MTDDEEVRLGPVRRHAEICQGALTVVGTRAYVDSLLAGTRWRAAPLSRPELDTLEKTRERVGGTDRLPYETPQATHECPERARHCRRSGGILRETRATRAYSDPRSHGCTRGGPVVGPHRGVRYRGRALPLVRRTS